MFKDIEMYIKNNSKVVSLEHGIGRVIGRFAMYDGVDDYVEVKYEKDVQSRFFCLKNLSDVRLLSSKDEIDHALSVMNEKLNDESIENNCYESSVLFSLKDITFIVSRIVGLVRKDKLSLKEHVLLKLSLNSLINEIKEVYKVDQAKARFIINDHLMLF